MSATAPISPESLDQVQAHLAHLIAWHQQHHPDLANIWGELIPLQEKLVNPLWQVAVLGQVSRGKSALINALIGQPQFPTGPLHGVTLWPHSVRWQPVLAGEVVALDLTDTPGLDESGGEQRAAMAWEVAQQADLVLFVTAGPLNPVELAALKRLAALKVTVFLVANKQDLYLAWTQADIQAQLAQAGLGYWIAPEQILQVSAAPVADPGLEFTAPMITPLLTALTTWLEKTARQSRYEQIQQQILVIEKALGTALLEQPQPSWRSLWFFPLAGVGILLCPWSLVDLLMGLGSSFALVRMQCRTFGIPLTPPASHQAWRVICLTSLGIGLLGQDSWAWLLGESGWSYSAWFTGNLSQLGLWAWGLSRLGQITRTHIQNGYVLGSWGVKP